MASSKATIIPQETSSTIQGAVAAAAAHVAAVHRHAGQTQAQAAMPAGTVSGKGSSGKGGSN